MIRNFARINSIPQYRVEYKEDEESTPENPSTTARIIPPVTPPDNVGAVMPMPVSTKFINPHDEYQYLNLIHQILEQNQVQTNRNGNTIYAFGAAMVFSLDQGIIPVLTT